MISDIHGNLEALQAVLIDLEEPSAPRLEVMGMPGSIIRHEGAAGTVIVEFLAQMGQGR